jgi:Serine incorporator (Serinc)
MEDERYLYALLGVTVGCYAGIAAIVGLLFYWFNPAAAGDCSFNVTVIVLALVVALVLGAASMHPAVRCTSCDSRPRPPVIKGWSGFAARCSWTALWHQCSLQAGCIATLKCVQATNGSLFPAAVVSLYCTYLAYSALQSEPHDYQCNSLGKQLSAASGSTLALGMVCYLLSAHIFRCMGMRCHSSG